MIHVSGGSEILTLLRGTACEFPTCGRLLFFLFPYFFLYPLHPAAFSVSLFFFSMSDMVLDSDVELSYYVYREKMPTSRIRSTTAELRRAKCHERDRRNKNRNRFSPMKKKRKNNTCRYRYLNLSNCYQFFENFGYH